MAQNAKMAFLGFGTLSQSTLNFIEEVAKGFGGFEVAGCFDDIRQAAQSVVTVVDRKVTPVPGSILYIHESVDADSVQAAKNLEKVGVGLQPGWISWDDDFVGDNEAAVQWLGRNSFPAKIDPIDLLLFGDPAKAAPATAAEPQVAPDPLAALLAEAPAPTPAPVVEAAAAPAVAAEPSPAPAPIVAPAPAAPAPAPEAAAPAPAPEAAPQPVSFMVPPAAPASSSRPNPLIPGGIQPIAKQGEGAAFLAPGPELAQASGPTQANTTPQPQAEVLQSREAVAEFRLPPAMSLPQPAPAPAAPTQKWEDVIGSDKAAPIQEASPFPERLKFATKGMGVFWTGSAGGSGKTTISWTSANTLAAAYKSSGKTTPVYLVETDFGNPKLENRMPMGPSNTAIAYIKYLNWLEENRGVADASHIARVEAKAIEEATWTDPVTGLRVIAAPYDTRTSTSSKIQDAILKLSRKLLSEDSVVFFDSGTVGRVDDKMLDAELAHLSTHVLIATRAGERDDEGKWVHAQVDDMRRMAMTMSSSTDKGGWGLDRNKIQAFFNKTDFDSYEERRYSAEPVKVCGYLPYAPSLEGTWIGDITNDPAVDRAVTQLARALYEVAKIPELETFASAPEPELVTAEPAKKTRTLFGRKKG